MIRSFKKKGSGWIFTCLAIKHIIQKEKTAAVDNKQSFNDDEVEVKGMKGEKRTFIYFPEIVLYSIGTRFAQAFILVK